MILTSTLDLKKHVSVSSSFVFEDFEPYIDQAVNQFTRNFVGDLQEVLANEAPEGENKPILDKARRLLQNSLANFGMYLYIPLGTIMFDGSGMSNAKNDQREPISWQQQNDIQRGMLTAGHTAMDLLLELMERNKTLFPDWAASEYYTESKELIVNNTGVFNKYYHIFNSRQTYLALKPSLRQVEDQYLNSFLCSTLVEHLKETDPTGIKKVVKTLLQKAMVAFTVAKVASEGIFVITPYGMKLRFNQLPNDKVLPVDIAFLEKTAIAQLSNGQNYLKQVRTLITENIAVFDQCTDPIIPIENKSGFVHNTRSMLGL